MTLKNNRAHLLGYFKLCASFHSHLWIQTGVSQETPNLGKNRRFFLAMWPWNYRWPSKAIGHLSQPTSSFAHHFVAIGRFNLELQSRNAQFGSKSAIFWSRVTLKFDGWHLLCYFKLCYNPETPNLDKNRRFHSHHFIAICELILELQSWNG